MVGKRNDTHTDSHNERRVDFQVRVVDMMGIVLKNVPIRGDDTGFHFVGIDPNERPVPFQDVQRS
jgi:hypothetical protein